MNKIKKSIPTLVGSAMLLTNTSVLAIDEVINSDDNKQEIESELNVENSEISDESTIIISDNSNDTIVEVVENDGVNVEENIVNIETPVIKVELEETKDEVEVQGDTDSIEANNGSIVTHEELVNLLNNIRSLSQQKVMIVNKEEISVREGSDKDTNIVGTLKNNQYVDVYEQSSTEGWSKINFKGKMAYVNTSDLIDVEKEYKESLEADVSVRSGAGESYSEFGKLSKGERVQVFQDLSNGWSKISYNSKIAFVETSKLTETYLSKAIVSVEKINVYKTASKDSDILGESKKDETLFIYGEENGYYKVKFGESFGYIEKDDLTLLQNTEKPQTGDAMVFSYMGVFGVSVLGMVSVNRKKK